MGSPNPPQLNRIRGSWSGYNGNFFNREKEGIISLFLKEMLVLLRLMWLKERGWRHLYPLA